MNTEQMHNSKNRISGTIAIRVLLLIMVMTVASHMGKSVAAKGAAQNHKLEGQTTMRLSLSANLDKKLYKSTDKLNLETVLSNDMEAPVYLFGILTWGPSASLELFITNLDAHEEVSPNLWSDAHPLPPSDQTDFIKLNPHHFWGTHRRVALGDLNAEKPGKYQLQVVYHAPLLEKYGQGLPIWGKERGTISSNLVEFAVIK